MIYPLMLAKIIIKAKAALDGGIEGKPNNVIFMQLQIEDI